MASLDEIGLTYNWMSRFFPRVFGPTADISCAFYDGDYSKSLEQAQRDKHEWVLEGVGFEPGRTVFYCREWSIPHRGKMSTLQRPFFSA